MYTSHGSKRHPKNNQPTNSQLILNIQKERDFLMAKAANQGHGQDILRISQLPDEHFKYIIATTKE